MSKPAWCTVVLGVVLAVAGGSGCRKNASAEKQIDAALKQPAAAAVMSALDKKDYEGALTAWMNAKMAVTNQEQQAQFSILTQETKLRLFGPAETNAQAADALRTLRMMGTGR